MLFLSSCNMPTPQQRPGDPTPDINLILTQIAAEHQSEANTATPAETEKVPTETPGPTATPQKKETLTVCLGKEPQTLFFYAESSQAMWSVLEAFTMAPLTNKTGNRSR